MNKMRKIRTLLIRDNQNFKKMKFVINYLKKLQKLNFVIKKFQKIQKLVFAMKKNEKNTIIEIHDDQKFKKIGKK